MIEVELADSYVVKGSRLSVRVSHPQVLEYRQLQVEVFELVLQIHLQGLALARPRLGWKNTLLRLKSIRNTFLSEPMKYV
ncbi:MAG: hypothetical protein HYZ46_02090 [Nitrosomonadales bacterium]|nr:hypothetical protein [Nitrosomonadales bacterium]